MVGGKEPARRSARDRELAGEAPVEELPKHLGARVASLAIAYAIFGPLVWLTVSNEAWFEARGLWLAACLAALTLGTLPLRMAIAAPESAMSASEAARHYGLRMVGVLGIAVGAFLCQAAASRLVTSPIASLLLGMFFLLAALLALPFVIGALRGKRPVRHAITGAARGIGAAIAIVGLCALAIALRASRSSAPPETITIPADPKSLIDPLDLESVPVSSIWSKEAGGESALHLSADGGDFDRSMLKLSTHIIGMMDALRARPGASGSVTLWLPRRFDSPAHHQAADDEARAINEALSSTDKRTLDGRPIRVAFVFGEPPSRP